MINDITICGIVSDRKYYNSKYNKIVVDVMRTSGTVDKLPVMVPANTTINNGDNVRVKGELLTYDDKYSIDNKLKCFIRAKTIDSGVFPDEVDNLFMCEGIIVKTPIFRITPTGRRIKQFIIANNTERSNYIPCVCWGNNAIIDIRKGDLIRAVGRFQARNYTKENHVKTAYEVSLRLVKVETLSTNYQQNDA